MERDWLLFKLALRNIRLNWRHSLATAMAIIGGFAAVSMFDGFMLSIKEYNDDRFVHKGMVGHVVIERSGSGLHLFEDPWKYTVTVEDQAQLGQWLREDKRVVSYMRDLVYSGMISNGHSSVIFIGTGLEDDKALELRGDRWKWNTVAGQPLFKSGPDSFLAGMGLAKRLECEFDPSLKLKADGSYLAEDRPLRCANSNMQLSSTTQNFQANAANLNMVGVMDLQIREFNDKVLISSLASAQKLMDTDRITRVHVLLRDSSDIKGFVADLRKKISGSGLDIEALPWEDHPVATVAKSGNEILGVFRMLFLVIVAIVAAMSVANSMMKSMNERIREIGTLRSFGFKRADIRLMFSFEGLLLGAWSCGVGVVFSFLLALAITYSGITYKAGILSSPVQVTISIAWGMWLLTAVLLSALTWGTAWVVAGNTSRRIIADALRHVA